MQPNPDACCFSPRHVYLFIYIYKSVWHDMVVLLSALHDWHIWNGDRKCHSEYSIRLQRTNNIYEASKKIKYTFEFIH